MPAAVARGRLLILLAPITALFLVGFAAPFATIIRYSLNGFSNVLGMQPGLTIVHYRDVLISSYFRTVFGRSVLISLSVVLVDILLGYPLALAIARAPRALRMPILGLVILPLLVSVVVRTFGWEVLLGANGPVAAAAQMFIHHRIVLLYNIDGIIIGLAHVLLPFMVLSLLGSLTSLDPHFEDAAASLGADPFRTFRLVTLPLTLEGLATGSMLVFVLALSAFVTPEVLGGGKVEVLAGVIFDQATGALNWPLASAVGVLLLIVTLGTLLVYRTVLLRLRGPQSLRRGWEGSVSAH